MKKFVSMVCALAVAAVLAVPAMAADNSAVIAALQNAGASASQVSAAQTYLDAVDLSAESRCCQQPAGAARHLHRRRCQRCCYLQRPGR